MLESKASACRGDPHLEAATVNSGRKPWLGRRPRPKAMRSSRVAFGFRCPARLWHWSVTGTGNCCARWPRGAPGCAGPILRRKAHLGAVVVLFVRSASPFFLAPPVVQVCPWRGHNWPRSSTLLTSPINTPHTHPYIVHTGAKRFEAESRLGLRGRKRTGGGGVRFCIIRHNTGKSSKSLNGGYVKESIKWVL